MAKGKENETNYNSETPEVQDLRHSREIADELHVDYMANGTPARIVRRQIAENARDSDIATYDKRERKALRNRGNHSTKVQRELISADGVMMRRYYFENKEGRFYVQIKCSVWSAKLQKLYSILLTKLSDEWRKGNVGITEICIPEYELLDVYNLSTSHQNLKELIEGATGGKINDVELGVEYARGGFDLSPIFSGSRGVRDGVARFGLVNGSAGDRARIQSFMTYYAVIPESVRGMSASATRLCEYFFEQARMCAAKILADGEISFSFEEVSREMGLPSPDNVDTNHARAKCINPVFDAIDEANNHFKQEENGNLRFTAENGGGKTKETYATCTIHLQFTGEWKEYYSAKGRDLQDGKDKNIKRIKGAKRKQAERARKKDDTQTQQQRAEADEESEKALADDVAWIAQIMGASGGDDDGDN